MKDESFDFEFKPYEQAKKGELIYEEARGLEAEI